MQNLASMSRLMILHVHQKNMKSFLFAYLHNEALWKEQRRFPRRWESGLREQGGTTGLGFYGGSGVVLGTCAGWGLHDSNFQVVPKEGNT